MPADPSHTTSTALPPSERSRATVRNPAGSWRTPAIGAGIVLVVLVAIRVFSPEKLDIPQAFNDFFTLTLSVLIESLPFVVLGVLLSILVQVWLPAGVIERFLPSQPFLRRACISLLGMFLPVCECGNVPLARGLMMRGFTVPESMTFLIAAPILNPIVIVTTHAAFGWDSGILVWRILGGFVLANLIGWIFSRHPRPASLLTPAFEEACRREEHTHGSRLGRTVEQFQTEARAVMPALIIGCSIAGAVQVLVPRSALVALGTNPVLSVAALMLLAVVISICSNVDAFFILSFGSTFLPGAIVAFLVLGPVVDVKLLALMRTTFTTRTLAAITLIAVLFTGALGLVVNLVG
jgi:uncharacterized membrane protein YraQ (UPF0718 family)